jgi:hypothetical protein
MAGASLIMQVNIKLRFPKVEEQLCEMKELIMRTKADVEGKLDELGQAVLAETEQGRQIKAGLDQATAGLATLQTKVDELTAALEQAGQPVPEVDFDPLFAKVETAIQSVKNIIEDQSTTPPSGPGEQPEPTGDGGTTPPQPIG